MLITAFYERVGVSSGCFKGPDESSAERRNVSSGQLLRKKSSRISDNAHFD
jgi:hypothetical protein